MSEPTGAWDARVAMVGTVVLVVAVAMLGWGFAKPEQEPPDTSYADMRPAVPMRLVVPSQRIRARVQPIDINAAGALIPPANARQVGWWRESARPGAHRGQTVITGHTLHTGGGAMNRLGRIEPGKRLDVVTRRGRMRYSVDRVATLSYQQVADRAERLFGQRRSAAGRLVLVTCTDFDGRVYQSNIIVFATPLGVPEGAGPRSSRR